MEFERNVGSLDRVLRIAVGLALLSLVFIGPKTLWGLLGLWPLATGFFRFCPAYTLIRRSSASRDRDDPPGPVAPA